MKKPIAITAPPSSVKVTSPCPDVLLVCYCVVAGENDELLGFDETPITDIYWSAIDVAQNEVIREGRYEIDEEPEEKDETIEDIDMEEEERHECKKRRREERRHEKRQNGKGSGSYLEDAIEEFEEVIRDLREHEKVVGLVTENGHHLRQCLHPQCFEKNIEVSDTFYKYYDLRKQYKMFTELVTPVKNLAIIAQDMDVENHEELLTTPEKKSKFCARVVRHLLKEGHKFAKVEEIYKSLEPAGRIANGFVKDETIARARGLPWQVSDVDVADFFYGLNIERGGVAMCLNQKGRRNGEALVRFSCSEHREMALRRHKHHLFGRYIEVYKGTAQEFLKIAKGPAVAMQAAEKFLSRGGDVIIRMRGLPFDSKEQEIVDFFGDSPEVHEGVDGVMLVTHPDGSSTGDAFVLFKTEGEGQTALKKHRENIGKRYVELFRSTRAELQQVLTMYNAGYQMVTALPGGHIVPSNVPAAALMADRALINQRLQALMNMSCLRMRGLPFSAGQKDILNFLSTHADFVVGSVHIIFNLQGRPSGEAFVQMQNPDFAHKCANELHLKHMGERYIEVFQCSVQDMTWMLATSHANQLAAQHLNQLTTNNSKNNNNNSNHHHHHHHHNSNSNSHNNNTSSNNHNHTSSSTVSIASSSNNNSNSSSSSSTSSDNTINTTNSNSNNNSNTTTTYTHAHSHVHSHAHTTTTFRHPNPPSPQLLTTTQAPPMNGLIATPPPPPPPITTNGFLPQNIPAFPIFTNQYPPPPMLSPVPGCFLPPPPPHMAPADPSRLPFAPGVHQPMMQPVVFNPETVHFQVNQYGKMNAGVTYITFNSHEEAQRHMQHQEKLKMNNPNNRYMETMFIAH